MRYFTFLLILFLLSFNYSCRRRNNDVVTVALSEKFTTLDTLTSTGSDAAADRVRTLIFNTLVKKDENFDYTGELASDIKTSADGLAITFLLRDNVKFHNGALLTSKDVKYTFDELFKSGSFKSGAFFDTVDKKRVAHITSIETPDDKTVVFNISRPSLKNQLLPNLVAIPIIPQGTVEQQKNQPIGTGPFKFVSFDAQQNTVELTANLDYWDGGAPKIQKLRVKTVADANSLQAELQGGGVDIAPLPTNLSPDTIKNLGQNPNLKVEQFEGSNIQYLGFNTQSAPLDKVKVRQAIGYAIDREKIVKELLSGQAVIANSILPLRSWAYSDGTKYNFDQSKAKQLLKEANYNNEPITFKFLSGNVAVNNYSQVIQNSLNEVGLNVRIETIEGNTLREQLGNGQFQMNTGIWIGGNQDPIFYRDLFSTGKIPTPEAKICCNRSRYSNSEFDSLIENAFNETDRAKAKDLYVKAQEIVSNDLPLFPLWYPANIVVVNKRIGSVKISPSGDWGFIKDVTVSN